MLKRTSLLNRTSPRFGSTAIGVGFAACAILALALLAGWLTAPGNGAVTPTLIAVHSSSAAIALPQLSQAAPLPALAAAPQAPVQPQATQTEQSLPPEVLPAEPVQPVQIQVPAIHKPSKKSKKVSATTPPLKPVRIVGSG